ncbi:MAG: PilZ domain-containing protein [Deltaproteobacteria bacterium]|nr:PilZ domain-containing protein [Deltaproteobacteria bacterium]
MDDRRRYTRHTIQVPVNVSTSVRRDRVGMIRDVSQGGILFHSLSKFEIGEHVALMFKLAKDRPGSTGGHVVRVDTDDHPDNIFRFLTAVRFDAPLLDLEVT